MSEGSVYQDAGDYLKESQTLTLYQFEGEFQLRIPYGRETFRDPIEAARKPCRHCNAVKGQLHEPLCDYEECPFCEGQVMSCDCGIFTENAVAPRTPIS